MKKFIFGGVFILLSFFIQTVFAQDVFAARTLTIVSPVKSAELFTGQTYTIKWETTGFEVSDTVKITRQVVVACPELAGGATSCPAYFIANEVNALAGSYSWTIPMNAGKAVTDIRVGYSSSPFPVDVVRVTIKEGTVSTITSTEKDPIAGGFAIGSDYSITGWACDLDTPNSAVTVKFYDNAEKVTYIGATNNTLLSDDGTRTGTLKNVYDAYVKNSCGNSNHYFKYDIPAQFRNAGQKIVPYVVDTKSGGEFYSNDINTSLVVATTQTITATTPVPTQVTAPLKPAITSITLPKGALFAEVPFTLSWKVTKVVGNVDVRLVNRADRSAVAFLAKEVPAVPVGGNISVTANVPAGDYYIMVQSRADASVYLLKPISFKSASERLSISNIAGPRSVSLRKDAEWKVIMKGSDVGLGFLVDWADGTKTIEQKSNAFTHTYAKAGIYKAVFTATSGSKNTSSFQETKASLPIEVLAPGQKSKATTTKPIAEFGASVWESIMSLFR